jgi:hypothetical protein
MVALSTVNFSDKFYIEDIQGPRRIRTCKASNGAISVLILVTEQYA